MATINVTYVTLFFVLKTISSLTRTAVYFLAAAIKTIYMNMKIGNIYIWFVILLAVLEVTDQIS